MDRRIRILVVDDEVDLCLLIKENLELTGEFFVTTVTDPLEVENALKESVPELILMDVVMPKRKGSEIAQALKGNERTQNIPIIIMSGLGEMVYFKSKNKWLWLPNRPVALERGESIHERIPRIAAGEYGVDGYIEKPFATPDLIRLIQETLRDATAR